MHVQISLNKLVLLSHKLFRLKMAIKYTDLVRKYDGSVDVQEWLEKLEMVCDLQGIKKISSFLPLFLEKGAFSVYQTLSTDVRNDYGQLKQALLSAFSLSPQQAYNSFISRKLLPGESVDVFVADLKRLAILVSPYLNEEWVTHGFIAGLPSRIVEQITAASIKSTDPLDRVVQLARNLMRTTGSEFTDVTCVAQQKPRIEVRCFSCEESGHISRFCPNKKTLVNATCYNCGGANHLSKHCTSNKNLGSNNNQGNERRK